jgi:hypothetical protein
LNQKNKNNPLNLERKIIIPKLKESQITFEKDIIYILNSNIRKISENLI